MRHLSKLDYMELQNNICFCQQLKNSATFTDLQCSAVEGDNIQWSRSTITFLHLI